MKELVLNDTLLAVYSTKARREELTEQDEKSASAWKRKQMADVFGRVDLSEEEVKVATENAFYASVLSEQSFWEDFIANGGIDNLVKRFFEMFQSDTALVKEKIYEVFGNCEDEVFGEININKSNLRNAINIAYRKYKRK